MAVTKFDENMFSHLKSFQKVMEIGTHTSGYHWLVQVARINRINLSLSTNQSLFIHDGPGDRANQLQLYSYGQWYKTMSTSFQCYILFQITMFTKL